ncbi:hypothetical protein A3K48_05335 [candidate division WOR-1 bacterium RIFOXYA12_FULL_52_29]|uniref:Uncharacterized protein n=1 Tax=candidate division WOR-1 bacterium RIFOXYC12_FULL_54_18 TaxID=1802584 RepID=A0A1F4T6P7_UNCSA|nr:MAG: hypothetical protein A3K44_05335 [candidate division WOR-1 bacterium RIFOXYA2_FULL_51_19]OGC17967.1 MAG: hypothetical protein A3K48_05335 [candidate division WOR-1 bacterium RIFOXYA12_FULL_52_29]OGC26824.1 MAG: hypothetical protein A3K32_05330 [candidate division WOR-1 bacterium RIFOXYB2_FULL_45_9]OGC28384.1 MAG: hypothetical protein A3K49_05335 [candidate division WOR-1 bacterium RIFOXYC12_FULL_54_18]OGC31160.1 MAG: hypothetical protein A2346_07285 [candidate division WOR-1 bacterium R
MTGRRGFTLIEMMLAIGLLAAIIPTIYMLLSAGMRSAEKIIGISLKRQAETILIARVTRDLRSAASQTVVSSIEIALDEGCGYVYEEGIVKRKTAVKQPLTNPGEINRFICETLPGGKLSVIINQREILVRKK